MRENQSKIATREECAIALHELSDDDLAQLETIARLRAIRLRALDWRDLLHDAIDRLLDGKRKWPKEVPLVVFLRETMRSIQHVEVIVNERLQKIREAIGSLTIGELAQVGSTFVEFVRLNNKCQWL